MLYSAQTGGFYLAEIHGAAIPADAVEITGAEHAALIEAQEGGAAIQPDAQGRPVAVTPTPPTEAETLAAWREVAVVSRFQARAALHLAGELAAVEAAVASADAMVQIAWADAQEFRRNSPTIAALAAVLGMDDDALDTLFQGAALITA